MTVTCTETAECDKWAEIVALAQQGNKKMLGVILQAFDIKLRKIAHTSAYKGFAEDGEQIERVAVVKALEKWGQRQDFEKLPAFIVSKSYTAISFGSLPLSSAGLPFWISIQNYPPVKKAH